MSAAAPAGVAAADLPVGRPIRRRPRFRVRGNEMAIVGGVLVGLVLLVALLAPLLATHDPERLSMATRLRPPSEQFWFGTDEFGRDIYSRIVYGSRISLVVAATVIVVATSIGVTLGAFGAYRGGRWDEAVMRLADVFMAFPDLVLAMALSAAFGANLISAVIAVSIVWWPTYARLIRGQILGLKQQTFVEAARAVGASDARILSRHLIPNTVSPLLVRITTDIGYAILYTASLGFLGLGAQEPTPEWGRMIATGRFFLLDQWWYATLPGIAIFVTVLGFTWLGDALRDWTDPRTRNAP